MAASNGTIKRLVSDKGFGFILADAVAQVPLQLDAVLADGPAGPAGPLEVLGEVLEKGGVLGETEDDRDGLAAPAGLFHAELGDRPVGDGGRRLLAALAAALRLATAGADAPGG